MVVDADRVNDNFFPSIAADGNGVVHMSWFDAQAANPEFYSVYANYATTKPALSFATPLQLTGTIDSGTGFIFAPFIGDYAGIAATVNGGVSEAHPVWTDGGIVDFPLGPPLGPPSGQLQTTKLMFP